MGVLLLRVPGISLDTMGTPAITLRINPNKNPTSTPGCAWGYPKIEDRSASFRFLLDWRIHGAVALTGRRWKRELLGRSGHGRQCFIGGEQHGG